MKIRNITIEDTTFYKGLAILMIFFHNYFHWINPAPGENEMEFKISVIQNYISSLFILPEYSIQTTFSLLGHYGVQMFIFLSAYGLTKKYMKKDLKYFSFLTGRTIKIYIPFLITILVWGIYVTLAGWTWGQDTTFTQLFLDNKESLIYKITLISNFIPEELFAINGPWWFVSLIFQFYIIFPFLLKLNDKKLLYISIISLVITGLFYFSNIPFIVHGTFIAHIPEFAFGIYLAKKGELNIEKKYMWLIGFIFILGNILLPFWFLTDITVLILLVLFFQYVKENSSKITKKFILEIGIASMFIFYLNGFMRNPFVNIAGYYESWWGTILIGFAFFTIVLFFSMLLTRLNILIDKSIIKK